MLQKLNVMKNFISLTIFLALQILLLASCDKEDTTPNATNFPAIGEEISRYQLVFPENYNIDSSIYRIIKSESALVAGDWTEAAFGNTTDDISSGEKITMAFYPILLKEDEVYTYSEDCIRFIEEVDGLLLGGKAITYFFEKGFTVFPRSKRVFSFDKESMLPFVDNSHRMPAIFFMPNYNDIGTYILYLDNFDRMLQPSDESIEKGIKYDNVLAVFYRG
jgi:hypothetical protein